MIHSNLQKAACSLCEWRWTVRTVADTIVGVCSLRERR